MNRGKKNLQFFLLCLLLYAIMLTGCGSGTATDIKMENIPSDYIASDPVVYALPALDTVEGYGYIVSDKDDAPQDLFATASYEYKLYAGAPVTISNGEWLIIHLDDVKMPFELAVRAARVESCTDGQILEYGYILEDTPTTVGSCKLLDEALFELNAKGGSLEWLYLRNASAEPIFDITIEIR